MRSRGVVGRGGDGQSLQELERTAVDDGNASWSSSTSRWEVHPLKDAATKPPLNALYGVSSECPAHPLQSSPALPSPDLGILYLDEGFPRGSTSRSIVNRWTMKNNSHGRNSKGNNGRQKGKKDKAVAGAVKIVCPVIEESGEYGGLYGSDDDVDTTAWDLGSVSGGVSEEGSEEEESPKVVPGGQDGVGDGSIDDTDFILDAIDNEADLGENCFGFGADADSDGPPDPGAQERQRERNARLTGLLRMLSQKIETATANKPTLDGTPSAASKKGDRCTGGADRSHGLDAGEGAGGIGEDFSSSFRTTRALDVLVRVMSRPRGPTDASPPGVTELPALLAARMVISLVLRPLLSPRQPGRGRFEDRRRASSTMAGTRTDDDGGSLQQQRLLGEACRHLFEVSKKAGADEAFFSSGAVAGLLEFVEAAASDLGLTSGVGLPTTSTPQGQKTRGLRFEETGLSPCGEEADLGSSTSTSGTRSSGRAGSSHSNAGWKSTVDDDLLLYGEEHIQSVYDSLTFAIGCLKNVSADEGLQDRLVEAGSIPKLSRLVRSTRDLCRRRDESRKKQSTEGSQESSAGDQGEGENQLNNEPVDLVGEAGVGGGGGGHGSDRVPLLDRVAPLLAQAISLLRDLAAAGKDRSKAFRAGDAVRTLCSIFPLFRGYQDVLLNTARALAKLSLQEKTRADINSNPAHARSLLAALVEQGRGIDVSFRDLEGGCCRGSSRSAAAARRGPPSAVPAEEEERRRRRYWEKQGKRIATCVRIAFALGNLTSASDENRRVIGIRLGGSESLPALLLSSSRAHLAAWESLRRVDYDHRADFADRTADGSRGSSGSSGSSSSINDNETRVGQAAASFFEKRWSRRTLRRACDGLEEMLVKTLRLLANISIHREVGRRVCRHPGLAALEPLVGTCLELFGLFEDGALPQADPCCQQGRRSGAGPGEALMVPGEELLLNAVSLVTNLSFYGPDVEDSRATLTRLASPSSVRDGSNSSSSSSRVDELVTSATTAGSPHASTLFALASKARREVDKPKLATGSGTGDNCLSVEGDKGVGNVSTVAASDGCRPADSAEESGGGRRREVLCGHLVKVLLHPNAEAVAEAARAFGNFSRDRSCREAMNQRRANEVLVALLGHRSREVVFAAAGALVNVAADKTCKALLSRESVGAGERLARLVRRAGLADPSLAELACHALHNLLIEPLPPGGAEQVLGGPSTFQRLWWTLKELMEACSCEGLGVESFRVGSAGGGAGSQGGEREESREPGGFPAAAAAVWGALNQGKTGGCAPPYDLVYEEL